MENGECDAAVENNERLSQLERDRRDQVGEGGFSLSLC
jgi:hypothetical protein